MVEGFVDDELDNFQRVQENREIFNDFFYFVTQILRKIKIDLEEPLNWFILMEILRWENSAALARHNYELLFAHMNWWTGIYNFF